jgi:large subunit ribosomal protein L15
MPLIRRIPKRGFTNIFAQEVSTVNVSDLDRFPEGTVVTPALLVQHRVLRKKHQTVKILGNGELTKKLVVEAHAFSAGAKAKIEAAGGKAEELKG